MWIFVLIPVDKLRNFDQDKNNIFGEQNILSYIIADSLISRVYQFDTWVFAILVWAALGCLIFEMRYYRLR